MLCFIVDGNISNLAALDTVLDADQNQLIQRLRLERRSHDLPHSYKNKTALSKSATLLRTAGSAHDRTLN
jgi:RNase adaptor protein for sRNA GlmZ degradation